MTLQEDTETVVKMIRQYMIDMPDEIHSYLTRNVSAGIEPGVDVRWFNGRKVTNELAVTISKTNIDRDDIYKAQIRANGDMLWFLIMMEQSLEELQEQLLEVGNVCLKS